MQKSYSSVIGAVATMLFPAVIFAQTMGTVTPLPGSSGGQQTLATLIGQIIGYLNMILVLMMGLAIVMFVWYIIRYFIRPDADRKEAGSYLMYSIIGFFVILSFWGIVNILQGTFKLGNSSYQPASWSSFTHLFPSQ